MADVTTLLLLLRLEGTDMRQEGVALWLKRSADRTLAAAALLVLAPAAAAVAVAVRFSMGSPVLFRQQRPGFREKPFELVKFRTMRDARRADGTLLPDADRLTSVGRFIRSTSLDELPQLLNVLRGEMSLVGPRPLMMEYLDRYSDQQKRRHDVMPGITGWSQINGRNSIAWPEKLALDIWYVDHWTPWLDLRILMLTALRIAQRQGIAPAGQATMPVFMGNEPEAT